MVIGGVDEADLRWTRLGHKWLLSIYAISIDPVQIPGNVCVVNGRPFPSKLAPRINKPGERVKSLGFAQTMEQTAYSWFNRIIVIRYMELHDYLGHGRRIEKLMLKGFAA